MPTNRLARCLSCLLLVCAPACQSFYSYRPVTIVARDAETGQPISGAVVHISYPLVHATQAPFDSVDASASDGVVYLRAAPFGPAGVMVETKALGYMPEQKTLPIETVEAIKPAGWFENVKQRPPSVTIEMYADPRPSVELVLPNSLRGVITVDVKIDANAPRKPGQRDFTFAVPITGNAELTGPPLLERVAATDYRARYADGTRLSRDAKGLEIGFWGLNADGTHLTFLVGTRDEFEVRRRDALANDAAARGGASSSKGSGGGRRGGHGGGRGGQGQSDPSAASSGSSGA